MAASWNQFDSGLTDPLRQKLDALRQAWGRDFSLNSGYRDPRANAIAGGGKGSQHLHGNAVDIDVSTWSQDDRRRFLDAASKIGFGGLGVYDNAVHLDIGPRRAWGKDHTSASIPAWSRTVIDPHLAGGRPAGPAKPIAESKPVDLGDYGSADERAASGNAFDTPPARGAAVAGSRQQSPAWGRDHYGGFIDWGGDRSYV